MYPQKHIRLHEQSISLLEKVIQAKQYIENARHTLYVFDNTQDPYHDVKLSNNRCDLVKTKTRYENLRNALVARYSKSLQALVEDALPKCECYNAVEISEQHYQTA